MSTQNRNNKECITNSAFEIDELYESKTRIKDDDEEDEGE